RGAISWGPSPPPRWVVIGGFVGGCGLAVLLGLLGAACQLATAYGRVMLRVDARRLSVAESGVLGGRVRAWDRGRLRAIRAAIDPGSGARSVVVELDDGSRAELLDHCPAEDVKWVAAVLRGALGVPATRRFEPAG